MQAGLTHEALLAKHSATYAQVRETRATLVDKLVEDVPPGLQDVPTESGLRRFVGAWFTPHPAPARLFETRPGKVPVRGSLLTRRPPVCLRRGLAKSRCVVHSSPGARPSV